MGKYKFGIKRYVPQKVLAKLRACWKDNNGLEIEYFYYILDLITRIPTWNKGILDKYDGFIPLNAYVLKTVIGTNYSHYIKFLLNKGIITSDKIYVKNEKSKGYKFTDMLESDLEEVLIPPKHRLYDLIIKQKNNQKKNYSRQEDYIKIMRKYFYKIQFDFPNAFAWVEKEITSQNKKNCSFLSLKKIQEKDFFFDRNKTNYRLDSNLTNLKRELKSFLKGDLVCIDLKNSQPVLLNYLLFQIFPIYWGESEGRGAPALCFSNRHDEVVETFGRYVIREVRKIPQKDEKAFYEEFIRFHKWTMGGIFYDEFLKHIGGELTRDEVKKLMFKVMYSPNFINNTSMVLYQKEKEYFRQVFPYISHIIFALKRKDHTLFSVFLQKLESELFIDKMSKALVERGIVPLTIHDSFIIERKDKERASLIAKEVLKEYFLENPKFSVEFIKN